jgi:hypothetical protein
MSKRSITIATIEGVRSDEGNLHTIRISVDYNAEGVSYFSGNRIPGGYSVHVRHEEKTDMGTMFLMDGTANYAAMVAPASRFNARKLDQYAAMVQTDPTYHETLTRLTNRVIDDRPECGIGKSPDWMQLFAAKAVG